MTSRTGRHRVLLVEDYADLAEATADFLRRFGLDVQVALSGRQALDIAETFQPIIVLCDLRLPDTSGLDLARALRARHRSSTLLVALLTAVSETELRSIEHSAVDLLLSKPLTKEKLDAVLLELERLLRQGQSASAVE
ncbi:MAG TPA: response regulator [Vicinamibacterales bacterium]|nr:response regulator [Vicinamibacterales bacterium]